MSTVPDSQTNPPESLTGDYIVISVVTNPGAPSTETNPEEEFVIGQTMGDVELGKESEVAETVLHENEITQQRSKHFTLTLEFTLAAVPGQPQLETMNLYESPDTGGAHIGPAEWEAVRVRIYDKEPDLTVEEDDAWEFYGVEVDSELGSYSPGDPGEIPVMIYANGGHAHTNTMPTT